MYICRTIYRNIVSHATPLWPGGPAAGRSSRPLAAAGRPPMTWAPPGWVVGSWGGQSHRSPGDRVEFLGPLLPSISQYDIPHKRIGTNWTQPLLYDQVSIIYGLQTAQIALYENGNGIKFDFCGHFKFEFKLDGRVKTITCDVTTQPVMPQSDKSG